MHLADLACRRTSSHERRAGHEHLVGGRHEGVGWHRQPRGGEGTRGPADRRADDHQDPPQRGARRVAAGQREDGDAAEPQRRPGDGGAARRVPGEQAQADQPQRYLRDEQGGQARWDGLLRDGDPAVAAGQQQHPGHPGGKHPARRHAEDAGPVADHEESRQQDPGAQEARAHRQQRRHESDQDPDTEVCRAPDEIHDDERGPGCHRPRPRGGRHGPVTAAGEPEATAKVAQAGAGEPEAGGNEPQAGTDEAGRIRPVQALAARGSWAAAAGANEVVVAIPAFSLAPLSRASGYRPSSSVGPQVLLASSMAVRYPARSKAEPRVPDGMAAAMGEGPGDQGTSSASLGGDGSGQASTCGSWRMDRPGRVQGRLLVRRSSRGLGSQAGGDPSGDLAHALGRVVWHFPPGLQPPGAARLRPGRDLRRRCAGSAAGVSPSATMSRPNPAPRPVSQARTARASPAACPASSSMLDIRHTAAPVAWTSAGATPTTHTGIGCSTGWQARLRSSRSHS